MIIMAQFILTIAFTSFNGQAMEETNGYFCQSTEDVVDAGYQLTIDASQRSAELKELNFAGLHKLADMSCQAVPWTVFPLGLARELICRDLGPIDQGLIVRFFQDSAGALPYASVRKLDGPSKETELRFGRLRCEPLPQP